MENQVFGNVTTAFSWLPNPTTRGSSDILQSCLITIGLCVWTAVHLNIPEDGKPEVLWISYQTWRKCGWVLIGLFAPELLIYTAWWQRAQARQFCDVYNEAFRLKGEEGGWRRWVKKIVSSF